MTDTYGTIVTYRRDPHGACPTIVVSRPGTTDVGGWWSLGGARKRWDCHTCATPIHPGDDCWRPGWNDQLPIRLCPTCVARAALGLEPPPHPTETWP